MLYTYRPIAPLALQVQFSDGTAGQVRFEHSHLTGVFAALNDPVVFKKVYVEGGAVNGCCVDSPPMPNVIRSPLSSPALLRIDS